jgi:hypothetical protein
LAAATLARLWENGQGGLGGLSVFAASHIALERIVVSDPPAPVRKRIMTPVTSRFRRLPRERRGLAALGAALILMGVLASAPADAQRILECQFVAVEPSSFVYGSWSYAADISGGYLHLLLVRPADTVPYVSDYTPLRNGMSIHKALPAPGSDSGNTASFELATVLPGDLLVLDQWSFGGREAYDKLTLRCPSHG